MRQSELSQLTIDKINANILFMQAITDKMASTTSFMSHLQGRYAFYGGSQSQS